MTITVLKVLFAPTIIAVGFRRNILPGYTPKPQRNEFRNYSISLSEFYLECFVKIVCTKREEERVLKKL